MRYRKAARWTSRTLVLFVVSAGLLGFLRWRTGNVGVVVPGRVYRSAQLQADALSVLIREHGIRTVLNLRGPNPSQEWYRAEKRATLAAGATQVDLSLASDQWLSRAQASALIEVLDAADYPILIHCQWGAERTGLVSAVVELLRPGGTPESARSQFALWYLFVKVRDGRVMAGHLDAYEAWLRTECRAHDPTIFRNWLVDRFEPREPTRGTWPYDPYPLVVITRPAPEGSGRLTKRVELPGARK